MQKNETFYCLIESSGKDGNPSSKAESYLNLTKIQIYIAVIYIYIYIYIYILYIYIIYIYILYIYILYIYIYIYTYNTIRNLLTQATIMSNHATLEKKDCPLEGKCRTKT